MISSPGSNRVHLAPGMASPWSAAKPSITSPARALPRKAAAIRPTAASAGGWLRAARRPRPGWPARAEEGRHLHAGRVVGGGPGDDPPLLLALGVAGRCRMAGGRAEPRGQFSPQTVSDAEQRPDHRMRKVMDDVNRTAPGTVTVLEMGAITVARTGGLDQGYLHHGAFSGNGVLQRCGHAGHPALAVRDGLAQPPRRLGAVVGFGDEVGGGPGGRGGACPPANLWCRCRIGGGC